MDPKIVISSKEMHWEFSHLVSLLLDVVRYTFGMADFWGPPSIIINFMINDVHEPSLYTKSCDDLAKIHLACFQKWENERNLRPKGKREGGGDGGRIKFLTYNCQVWPKQCLHREAVYPWHSHYSTNCLLGGWCSNTLHGRRQDSCHSKSEIRLSHDNRLIYKIFWSTESFILLCLYFE